MQESNQSKQPADGMSLGQRLRQAREQKGLSLRQFATQLGRHSGYVSRLEADFYEHPGLSLLHRAAEILGLDYAELVALTGQTVPQRLPELTEYLGTKYELDNETAAKLAAQFTTLLHEHRNHKRPGELQGT